jgi:hypothetical protein
MSIKARKEIMALFGRNRGFLNAPQQMKILSKVAEAQKSAQGPFSVRQAVANALKSCGFDDKGIGCAQEVTLTELIGQTYGIRQGQVERVEDYCKTKSQSEVGRALQDAIRFAQ